MLSSGAMNDDLVELDNQTADVIIKFNPINNKKQILEPKYDLVGINATLVNHQYFLQH
jgi:hypothetical protein